MVSTKSHFAGHLSRLAGALARVKADLAAANSGALRVPESPGDVVLDKRARQRFALRGKKNGRNASPGHHSDPANRPKPAFGRKLHSLPRVLDRGGQKSP